MAVSKSMTYNEKFVHLQIGSCKCKPLGALDTNRQWIHPLVTSWPSNSPYLWAYEVNCWVKFYLPDWLILSVMGSWTKSFENLIFHKFLVLMISRKCDIKIEKLTSINLVKSGHAFAEYQKNLRLFSSRFLFTMIIFLWIFFKDANFVRFSVDFFRVKFEHISQNY